MPRTNNTEANMEPVFLGGVFETAGCNSFKNPEIISVGGISIILNERNIMEENFSEDTTQSKMFLEYAGSSYLYVYVLCNTYIY